MNVPVGYEPLAAVLADALAQASRGKGKERHAGEGQPFADQPIMVMARELGLGFALGQAAKKDDERRRLPYAAARAELLGGIVYLASAVIALDEFSAQVEGDARGPGL